MRTRELCMELLGRVPEYKLDYVLSYLQGLAADEEADDLFCERMGTGMRN